MLLRGDVMFERLNQGRSENTKKFVLPGVFLILVAIGIFLGFQKVAFAMPVFVIATILIIIGSTKNRQLIREFKEKFVYDLLTENFEDVSYNPLQGVYESEVLESELLERPDRFYSNDLIEATHNGINFTMSDIHLQEVVRRDKHTEVRTIFQGPFMRFTFNKNFKGKLQVRERGFVAWFSKYKKIKMESITFNKTFSTYSTDDHTAFYILTPHLMEALLEMERTRRGDFYISFINGELFIALDNRRDNFEIPVFGKVDESIGDVFTNQFNIIKEIIDELRLNKNIFK